MTRRLAIVAAAAMLLVIAAACGGGGGDDSERSVVGIILDVQSTSLTQIESFTMRTNDGETLVFHVAPDARPDPQEGFVPGHLRSHAVAAEQVRIFYREENGDLLATRLVDQ